MKRPNKFLHAADLENWAIEHYPAIFSEWELSGLVKWVDFWDWLDEEYPEVFTAFRDGFRLAEMKKGKRR